MKQILIVVAAIVGVLVAAIAWRVHVQNAESEGPPTASGVIESEGVDLASRWASRVLEVPVSEGDHVDPGAILMRLECVEPEARLAEAEARLAAARARAASATAQARAASGQTRAVRATVASARARASALEAQQELAAREASRVVALGEYGTASQRDRAASNAQALEGEASAARSAASADRHRVAAASATADAASAQAEASAMEIGALEAVVRSARVTVDDCVIHAPRGGIVERLYYDPGELLPAGAIALRIVSRAELKAVVYLSNADFDVARLGETVSLEADAVPGRFFEAEIVRLGVEAEFTPRNVQTRSDRDRLVFPVEVRLRAPDSPLHAGMPVTVHFGGEGA